LKIDICFAETKHLLYICTRNQLKTINHERNFQSSDACGLEINWFRPEKPMPGSGQTKKHDAIR
jgi:hypothetical protein